MKQASISRKKTTRSSTECRLTKSVNVFVLVHHQNHLIVKVPPYQHQAITSAVCVGIYVLTNAGRSHDIQPFTYTPDLGLFQSTSFLYLYASVPFFLVLYTCAPSSCSLFSTLNHLTHISASCAAALVLCLKGGVIVK